MARETVAIGADHGGYLLKLALAAQLSELGFEIIDFGTDDSESVDYPDYAEPVVAAIKEGRAQIGVLICGSGIGMSIAANRHKEIRAALCRDVESATLARQHNDANILVLGGRVIDQDVAEQCLKAFVTKEFEGGRHQRRVAKLG
jgi:ribose 5-phosphate isomerase B